MDLALQPLQENQQPAYLQIAEQLRSAIKSKRIKPADKLPSSRILAQRFAVNRHTVMAALSELVAEGWLVNKQRSGYKVAQVLPIEPEPSHTRSTPKDNSYQDFGYPDPTQFEYNFAGGRPDIDLFPKNEFRRHFNQALNYATENNLYYAQTAGEPAFIEQLEAYLASMRGISGLNLMVVNGSQEAIYLAAQVLAEAGQQIAIETLGYPQAWQALASSGAELVPIEQDSMGIIPQDLERAAKAGNIKLLYLTPLHQYPTTVTLSVSRRQQIYQIARQYNFYILEDDYDHEFHFTSQPLAPMVTDDPDGRVIYFSTFSKVLFASIRIGFMALPANITQAFLHRKQTINLQCNNLLQLGLANWMKDGGLARHIRRCARVYQKRLQQNLNFLETINLFEFDRPSGGMAIWLKINRDSREVARLAAQSSIMIAEHSMLSFSPVNKPSYLRLGFTGNQIEHQLTGLNKLVTLICQLTPIDD